jgi:hypothetical protein
MPESKRAAWRLAASAALGSAIGLTALGQEPAPKAQPAATNDTRDDGHLERWKQEAGKYRFVIRTGPDTVPTLRPEPALHWTNPVRDADDGLVYLWLDRGRPEVISCFYRARWQGRVCEAHEFHSLSTAGLAGSLEGQTFWSPTAPGVTPRPIPGAPRPAAKPAERLRQLREMARNFKAFVDVEKGRTELRLLSQPVYRFEAGTDSSPTPDGALFAYVLTTDPEVWLMIEERPGEGGNVWHYSFARMSDHSLAARLDDRVVWEVPQDSDGGNPTKLYRVRWDIGPKP